jgi:toxin-antitoxin system PIN domain toxin
VIVSDLNLLVYAYNQDAPHHFKAADWWGETVNSGAGVGIAWPVFQSFLRLLSGRAAVTSPYSLDELFDITNEWWSQGVKLLSPSATTLALFRSLCLKYQTVGSASSDTLIAAFALEHRARLATNDTDILRYTELKVVNPLSAT